MKLVHYSRYSDRLATILRSESLHHFRSIVSHWSILAAVFLPIIISTTVQRYA